MTSIAKPFRENTAVSVLFYTTSAKDTKIIFEDYAGELMNDKKKELMTKLKSDKYSHVISHFLILITLILNFRGNISISQLKWR